MKNQRRYVQEETREFHLNFNVFKVSEVVSDDPEKKNVTLMHKKKLSAIQGVSRKV
jgi:hypothetical protein